MSERKRNHAIFATVLAGLAACVGLAGCTDPSGDSAQSPSVTVPALTTPGGGASVGTSLPAGGATDSGDTVPSDAGSPDDDPGGIGNPSGDMTLPDVQPAPDTSFCQTYVDYLNAGGPYSLQEAGDQLPPFTQADLDAYTQLQAQAPADMAGTISTMLAYGREMNQGDFTHGIDYENLLNGPGGLALYAIPYCQLDAGVA